MATRVSELEPVRFDNDEHAQKFTSSMPRRYTTYSCLGYQSKFAIPKIFMRQSLTVATANTHEARMLHDPDGLKPFADRAVDVVLMQEVLRVSEPALADRLGQDGYQVGHFDSDSGLAIAVAESSDFQPIAGSELTRVIQPPERLGEIIRSVGIPMSSRLRQRGLIAVRLAAGKRIVTAVDTHPIIFLRSIARARQVEEIGAVIEEEKDYFQDDPLVLGGDMNHYPSPRKVDLAMRRGAGLAEVKIQQPTWRIRGSKHEWAARIGSPISRRSLDDFNANLDVILFRGLDADEGEVIEIPSDHGAIIARLRYN